MYLRRLVLSFRLKSTRVPLENRRGFYYALATQSFCSLLSSKEIEHVQVRCFIKGYAITVKGILECSRCGGPIFSWLQGVSYHRILLSLCLFFSHTYSSFHCHRVHRQLLWRQPPLSHAWYCILNNPLAGGGAVETRSADGYVPITI